MPEAPRAALVLGLALILAGCGSGPRSESSLPQSASPTAKELPCEDLPPEANCPGPAPAKPVPMSPDGPVRVYKTEYWGAEETISTNGVYAVAATARGTFAVSGTVVDARPVRPPYDPPVEGAAVTFASVSGPGLPAPPGGEVRVTTETGYDGAFAFVNVPAASSGSCYRMTVVAPDIGRYESVDLIRPDVFSQTIELNGGIERDPFPYPTRGKTLPSLDRACARMAKAAD